MKQYQKLMASFFITLFLLIIAVNLTLYLKWNNENSQLEKVDINRLYYEIQTNGFSQNIDFSKYPTILSIDYLPTDSPDSEIKQFYQPTNESMMIKPIGTDLIEGYLKFIYTTDNTSQLKYTLIVINTCFILLAVIILIMLSYIKSRIMKPFHQIQEMPFDLSKGHLTNSLQENKNRFFGRFIWGLDLLRENLESHKKKEMQLEKEKKTMILSISHDIKTPLSAIKLYAKALEQGLYSETEKQKDVLIRIDQKADEIEQYVNEIIKTSKEDFLNIEVNNSEFYLTDLINHVKKYYQEKLELFQTKFVVHEYPNCILFGDLERSIEVLENIIENAIKYGDGNRIELDFTREENCQLITIINSGNTLPLNETVHIFESFWRGSNVANKQGSGLGLYICRQILTKMNGDIFASPSESEMKVSAVFKLR